MPKGKRVPGDSKAPQSFWDKTLGFEGKLDQSKRQRIESQKIEEKEQKEYYDRRTWQQFGDDMTRMPIVGFSWGEAASGRTTDPRHKDTTFLGIRLTGPGSWGDPRNIDRQMYEDFPKAIEGIQESVTKARRKGSATGAPLGGKLPDDQSLEQRRASSRIIEEGGRALTYQAGQKLEGTNDFLNVVGIGKALSAGSQAGKALEAAKWAKASGDATFEQHKLVTQGGPAFLQQASASAEAYAKQQAKFANFQQIGDAAARAGLQHANMYSVASGGFAVLAGLDLASGPIYNQLKKSAPGVAKLVAKAGYGPQGAARNIRSSVQSAAFSAANRLFAKDTLNRSAEIFDSPETAIERAADRRLKNQDKDSKNDVRETLGMEELKTDPRESTLEAMRKDPNYNPPQVKFLPHDTPETKAQKRKDYIESTLRSIRRDSIPKQTYPSTEEKKASQSKGYGTTLKDPKSSGMVHVGGVHDADSRLDNTRLAGGADAFEIGQEGGKKAKDFANAMLGGREVHSTGHGKDSFGRRLETLNTFNAFPMPSGMSGIGDAAGMFSRPFVSNYTNDLLQSGNAAYVPSFNEPGSKGYNPDAKRIAEGAKASGAYDATKQTPKQFRDAASGRPDPSTPVTGTTRGIENPSALAGEPGTEGHGPHGYLQPWEDKQKGPRNEPNRTNWIENQKKRAQHYGYKWDEKVPYVGKEYGSDPNMPWLEPEPTKRQPAAPKGGPSIEPPPRRTSSAEPIFTGTAMASMNLPEPSEPEVEASDDYDADQPATSGVSALAPDVEDPFTPKATWNKGSAWQEMIQTQKPPNFATGGTGAPGSPPVSLEGVWKKVLPSGLSSGERARLTELPTRESTRMMLPDAPSAEAPPSRTYELATDPVGRWARDAQEAVGVAPQDAWSFGGLREAGAGLLDLVRGSSPSASLASSLNYKKDQTPQEYDRNTSAALHHIPGIGSIAGGLYDAANASSEGEANAAEARMASTLIPGGTFVHGAFDMGNAQSPREFGRAAGATAMGAAEIVGAGASVSGGLNTARLGASPKTTMANRFVAQEAPVPSNARPLPGFKGNVQGKFNPGFNEAHPSPRPLGKTGLNSPSLEIGDDVIGDIGPQNMGTLPTKNQKIIRPVGQSAVGEPFAPKAASLKPIPMEPGLEPNLPKDYTPTNTAVQRGLDKRAEMQSRFGTPFRIPDPEGYSGGRTFRISPGSSMGPRRSLGPNPPSPAGRPTGGTRTPPTTAPKISVRDPDPSEIVGGTGLQQSVLGPRKGTQVQGAYSLPEGGVALTTFRKLIAEGKTRAEAIDAVNARLSAKKPNSIFTMPETPTGSDVSNPINWRKETPRPTQPAGQGVPSEYYDPWHPTRTMKEGTAIKAPKIAGSAEASQAVSEAWKDVAGSFPGIAGDVPEIKIVPGLKSRSGGTAHGNVVTNSRNKNLIGTISINEETALQGGWKLRETTSHELRHLEQRQKINMSPLEQSGKQGSASGGARGGQYSEHVARQYGEEAAIRYARRMAEAKHGPFDHTGITLDDIAPSTPYGDVQTGPPTLAIKDRSGKVYTAKPGDLMHSDIVHSNNLSFDDIADSGHIEKGQFYRSGGDSIEDQLPARRTMHPGQSTTNRPPGGRMPFQPSQPTYNPFSPAGTPGANPYSGKEAVMISARNTGGANFTEMSQAADAGSPILIDKGSIGRPVRQELGGYDTYLKTRGYKEVSPGRWEKQGDTSTLPPARPREQNLQGVNMSGHSDERLQDIVRTHDQYSTNYKKALEELSKRRAR